MCKQVALCYDIDIPHFLIIITINIFYITIVVENILIPILLYLTPILHINIQNYSLLNLMLT